MTDSARPDPAEDFDERDLVAELEELEAVVDSPEEREQVRETMAVVEELSRRGRFKRVVTGFDRRDVAESLVGSILLGIPMAVEGGTGEVAEHLAAHPPAFAGTLLFTLALVGGIIYVADIRDVEIRDPIAGVLPRRFAGVVTVSALTAASMLTVWGRVSWTDPGLALATVAVAWLPMSVGAALGDLLYLFGDLGGFGDDPPPLLPRLTESTRMWEADVIVLDSFDDVLRLDPAFARRVDEYDRRRAARDVVSFLRRTTVGGRTVVVTLDPTGLADATLDPFRRLADGVVELTQSSDGGRGRRRLDVRRFLGPGGPVDNRIGFRIVPGAGVVIDNSRVVRGA